ncbi:MAG: nitrogen regulation protein NR(II) [Gammaproteobacteria bacterium]
MTTGAGALPQPREILAGLSTAVLIVDGDGILLYLNAGAEDLLGLSARLSLGNHLHTLLPGFSYVEELLSRVIEHGEIFGQLISITPAHRGVPVEVACHLSPGPGSGQRVIVEMSDATQWRQIDREHALINQRDASRRMIRQLAHEIRNPLGGLRGAAQLLERELPTPQLREFTRIIIGEADRLTALTDSLLGPVRRPTRRDVNVHEILERVVALVASERRTDVQIVRDYDPSLPVLSADPDQLIQALLNIARNALEAVGSAGHLVFRTRALANFPIGTAHHKLVLCIEIEDDGPGVPADLAESIFYPLVTGRGDGTGLGLSISQDLVSRHGGLIEFQSRPGKTVFTIRVPFTVAEPVA